MRSIGLLGGTFDPVHCGHLRLAIEVKQRLALHELRLIPARSPALRSKPTADETARLAMLQASVEIFEDLTIDTRELSRGGPSYTVDTLTEIRQEHPTEALVLILGMDAYAKLEYWHRWTQLLELANIAVATRPRAPANLSPALKALIAQNASSDLSSLVRQSAGAVKLLDIPMLDISATYLRRSVANGDDIRLLTPDCVIRLIEENNLYANTQ